MTYHKKTLQSICPVSPTIGQKLGILAVRKKMPVIAIAKYTGASRSTIYSWFAGNGVTNAYKPAVQELIATLKNNK